jgi:hypothetical protein
MTYTGHSTRKRKSGMKLESHSIIHTSKESSEKGESCGQRDDEIVDEKEHHDRHTILRRDASRFKYAKIYTVEYNIEVWFVGYVGKSNMERMLCGDTAWEWSGFGDTGQHVPVIMDDGFCSSFSYRSSNFQLSNKHGMSPKITALLAMSSGLLMSGFSMWLNKSMEIYEPSTVMNKVILHLIGEAPC